MKITIRQRINKLLFTICASLLGIQPFSSSVVMGFVMNLLRGVR